MCSTQQRTDAGHTGSPYKEGTIFITSAEPDHQLAPKTLRAVTMMAHSNALNQLRCALGAQGLSFADGKSRKERRESLLVYHLSGSAS